MLSWLSAKAVAAAAAADSAADGDLGAGYGGNEAGGAASNSWDTLKISGGGNFDHDARSEFDLVEPPRWGTSASDMGDAVPFVSSISRFMFGLILLFP